MQKKTSKFRKLSIYGFQVTENSHNFYALLEFDITDLRKTLRTERTLGRCGSLFAFFIRAIGECLKLYPEFNSMLNLRKTTIFENVDISVPIEILKGSETYNKQLVIRDVERKSIREIDQEIEDCKKSEDNSKAYLSSTIVQNIMTCLPNFLIKLFFRFLIAKHTLVKKLSGTAFVTSVSMFSNVPGFIIPYIGKPKAASFAIGSIYKKPMIVNGEIAVREVVNITAIFNHDIIDGAPAARFINKLRNLIEKEYMTLLSKPM